MSNPLALAVADLELLDDSSRLARLAEGERTGRRHLPVFQGTFDEWPATGTVCGDPAGDCIVSTRVIGKDVLVLARGGVQAERTERFVDEEAGLHREIALAAVEEKGDRLISAEIVGVVARTIRPDVDELVRHVRGRVRISASALARFRKSGHLGGDIELRDPSRLCSCMRLGRADVLRAADRHGATLEAVRAATGATLLCGACVPDVCAALADRAPATPDVTPTRPDVAPAQHDVMPTRPDAPPAPPRSAEVPVGPPPPRVSLPDVRFDPDALEALRGVPEFHFMAVASVFAPTGERFMIRTVSRALASIDDPALEAHVEAFLAQESNHVAAHAPLNALLLERVFRSSRALSRLATGPFDCLDRLPLRLALSMCAAFECAADAAFVTFFERYYAEGGPHHHPDPEVYDLSVRSGVAALFHWHGAEELGHRHVAFEVMRALRTPYLVRALGFVLFVVISLLGLLPALWSLRGFATRPLAMAPRGTTALILGRTLAYLWPWFHPGDSHHDFLDQLASDAALYPSP